MIYDGLRDQYFPMTMASQGNKVAAELGMTREVQDRVRLASHRRARGDARRGALRRRDRAGSRRDESQGQNRRRRACRVTARVRVPAAVGGGSSKRVGSRTVGRVHVPIRQVRAVRDRRRAVHAASTATNRFAPMPALEAMAKLSRSIKTARSRPATRRASTTARPRWFSRAPTTRSSTATTRSRRSKITPTVAWDPPYICADARDGRAETARSHGLDARRHRGVGNQRSLCGRRDHVGAQARPRRDRRSTCTAARLRWAIRSAPPARASSAR